MTRPRYSYLTWSDLILSPRLLGVIRTSYCAACSTTVTIAVIEGSTMGRIVIADFQLSSYHVDSDFVRPAKAVLACGASFN